MTDKTSGTEPRTRAFQQAAQDELTSWKRKLEDLQRKAERGSEDARVEMKRRIEDLLRQRDELAARLGDAGDHLEEGVKSSGQSLRSALDSFLSSAKDAWKSLEG